MMKSQKGKLPFKQTPEGTQIIEEQIELIKKLGKIKKLAIDAFGPIEETGIDFLELNYYVPYEKDDIMKGQRHLISDLSCESEYHIISDLQNVIDVMYFMRYKMPTPRHYYFPNKMPIKPMTKKQVEKLLKDSVPL